MIDARLLVTTQPICNHESQLSNVDIGVAKNFPYGFGCLLHADGGRALA